MDNIDIAILSRLDQLSERHGLKPYDYVATLDNGAAMLGCGLIFKIPGETSNKQRAKVQNMLNALGVDKEGVLKGGEKAVIDAIDHALGIAPRLRRHS
jgi:hypothetical protein